MEQHVGAVWHRLISHLASRRYPDAAVKLSSMTRELAVLFRALGGDHGIALQAGSPTRHTARRSLLQRLAGNGNKVDLAWVDAQSIRLPQEIDAYPETGLNRDLYLWLTALCAIDPAPGLPWFTRNQAAAATITRRYSGLAKLYARLVTAELERRPTLQHLSPEDARQEQAIQRALHAPGSVAECPNMQRTPHPVLLWLRPETLPATGALAAQSQETSCATDDKQQQQDPKRRVAEYTEMPERQGGLLLFRPESIFSWSEYAKVQHATQENQDQDLAQAADDLDIIAITQNQQPLAKKLRMALDLPASQPNNRALTGNDLLPEWDYRSQTLRVNQCQIKILTQTDAMPCALPTDLRREQRRLQKQFGALRPLAQRLKAQTDGNDIDLDAYIRHIAQYTGGEPRFYQDQRKRTRDLACLLLADLSLSTEAWVGEQQRVIDVIRDSLFLFSEALSVTRDRFALYGFNSKQRHDVRFYSLKTFDETYDDNVRGKINAISPAYYTRMGAAIRQASAILGQQQARERLLLLLTDGKPNDADHYEGRYGVEDTRKALIAARQQGLHPFCVTIDQQAEEYLPHIFGKDNFIIIHKPSQLPTKLPLLYAQLTRC